MKRLVPLLSLVVAASVAGAAAWLLLHGEPGPAPPPPETAPKVAKKKPLPEPPPEFVPADPGPLDPPEEGAEEKEPPLPPDAYPWEVPGWWHEIDRRIREKEVVVDDEVRTWKDLLAQLEKDGGFPIRAGPELEAWAENPVSCPASQAPIRAVLEAIARRTNLEIVLTAEAVTLRQRGRAKEDRVTRAGRVQAAIEESLERRAGKRDTDPAAVEFAGNLVEAPMDGVALREAARRLGEKVAVPVYMDADLWAANPAVRVAAGEQPLSRVLDSLVEPLGAAWDASPRRIVLFRPR